MHRMYLRPHFYYLRRLRCGSTTAMAETPVVSRKGDWLASVATALSIVACYGTLLVVSALSLLGISLTVHTGAWAGAISLFAMLAVVGVVLGYRRHRVAVPLIFAVIGAGLIVWVMFGAYSRILELIGFAILVVAATWDWRLRRHSVAAVCSPEHQYDGET